MQRHQPMPDSCPLNSQKLAVLACQPVLSLRSQLEDTTLTLGSEAATAAFAKRDQWPVILSDYWHQLGMLRLLGAKPLPGLQLVYRADTGRVQGKDKDKLLTQHAT